MAETRKCQVLIVGAGPGGYVAGIRAGQLGLDAIVVAFGPDILTPAGSLDRKRLGAIVFADERARARLEAIVHPLIAARVGELIELARSDGEPFVVYDAALLVEWGMHSALDSLVVVSVPEQVQVDRIIARDGLTAVESRQRIAAQLPLRDKVAVADVVIDNSGTLNGTRVQVRSLVAALRARLGIEN